MTGFRNHEVMRPVVRLDDIMRGRLRRAESEGSVCPRHQLGDPPPGLASWPHTAMARASPSHYPFRKRAGWLTCLPQGSLCSTIFFANV